MLPIRRLSSRPRRVPKLRGEPGIDTPPDYDMCRQMFKTALTKAKYPLDGKIDFTSPKKAPKKGRKRKASDFEDLDFSEEIQNRKSSRIIRNNSENGRVSVGDPTPAA